MPGRPRFGDTIRRNSSQTMATRNRGAKRSIEVKGISHGNLI